MHIFYSQALDYFFPPNIVPWPDQFCASISLNLLQRLTLFAVQIKQNFHIIYVQTVQLLKNPSIPLEKVWFVFFMAH